MKKITYIFALLFFITFDCYSQNKGYIAVSYGASVPISTFDSKSVDSYIYGYRSDFGSAGYAKTGSMFEIIFAFKKPDQQIGFSAIFRNQVNESDMQALSSQLQEQYSSYTVTAEGRKWLTNALMLGGYAEIPLNKLSFDLRAMLAMVSVSSPEWKIRLQGPNYNNYDTYRFGSAFSFGLMTGAGLKIDVSKEICLMLNADLFVAAPEFMEIDYITPIKTFKQLITTYNISAGIGFRL